MFNRKLWIVILVLLALALLAPTVSASPPVRFDDGWWGNTRFDENGNVLFDFLVPSIGLAGTSTQPVDSSGRTVKGIFRGTVAGQDVECEYNLAAFTLPNGKNLGVSHVSLGHCADGVPLHMVGTAYLTYPESFSGTWEGMYHFDH